MMTVICNERCGSAVANDDKINEAGAGPGERCDHDVTLPFPFSFFELPATPAPSAMIASLSAEAAAASSIPGVTASQIRIVLSSEQDANIRSFFGFHATEFTLPSP